MSADSDKIRKTLDAQLSRLDTHLGSDSDDFKLLQRMQKGIRRLLASDAGSEAEIRRILQERFDGGDLRKETYQLVKSMLDNFVTENVPTGSPPDLDQTIDVPMGSIEIMNPAGHSPPAVPAMPPSVEELSLVESIVEEVPLEEVPSRNRVADLDTVEENPDDEFSSTSVIPNEELRPPTADDRVQVGSVLRDRFLLQERVSGGSMGVVYRAMDRRLAEAAAEAPWVAIKVLSPQLSRSGSALRALQQEAAKGRCLAHPGIVRFIDLDRDDDLYFIILEWLDGRTLADILDSPDSKSITPDRAIEIVRQIGKALDYAHKCGIVHADVKPGNVMVLPTGDTKIFDFGIARVLQAQSEKDKFDPGVLHAITPEYSSMQVLTGEEPVPADDVFSLGCLLYRIVAGYRVFGPRNAAEAAEEGMKPQRLRELPKHQWAALRKAMSFSRATRFKTMTDFIDALDNKLDEPIQIEPEEEFETESTGNGRKWLLGIVAITGLLVFAAYRLNIVERVQGMFEPAVTVPVTAPPRVGNAEEEQARALRQSADLFGESEETEAVSDAIPEIAGQRTAVPGSIGQATPEPLTVEPQVRLIDYSRLPAADFVIPLTAFGSNDASVAIRLREDGAPIVVDLVRSDKIHLALDIRIEEIGHSGNRSPWAAGQFEISDNGLVSFPAQQDTARITLTMASNPLREADQQSTLLIRAADSATTQLGRIELLLEDDDQRAFEARLPRNTVAFAVSQVAIGERDPAVQIDVLRFNPDNQSVVVGFAVKDITATEGQDYFSPGSYSISFAPGQRTARVLIPLVQDSVVEGDEAFTVELATKNNNLGSDVYQRIVVMIRDDDTPVR